MALEKYLENKSLAVIVVGNFNPSIIQPFWLAKKGLIPEIEAEETKVTIVHNELVSFDLGWVKVEVTPDRFNLNTTSETHFLPLRDLVIGIFYYLKETPATAVGINYQYKFGMQNHQNYYEFGDKIAPLTTWDFLNDARLTAIEVLEREREDKIPGHYRVRIEADLALSFGVTVLMNNHLDVKPSKTENNDISELIGKTWESAYNQAENRIQKLWSKLDF